VTKRGSEDVLSRQSQIVLALGKGFLRVLGATWRVRVVNGEALRGLRESRTQFIFALWHGHLLPLLWQHRGEGVTVLISEHRDGELVARAAESLGYDLIRGSSTRGAERALISLVRTLQAGKEIAITPDGPKGPPLKFAPGTLVAAQRSNSPILPVAVSASRAWRLKSWDRFLIPKPFARITVAYGPPTRVTAATAREAPAEAPKFEQLMAETVAAAGG
jgi:lysophospholipid acyltransferase (LPLAT)-like uncharacterized protein